MVIQWQEGYYYNVIYYVKCYSRLLKKLNLLLIFDVENNWKKITLKKSLISKNITNFPKVRISRCNPNIGKLRIS